MQFSRFAYDFFLYFCWLIFVSWFAVLIYIYICSRFEAELFFSQIFVHFMAICFIFWFFFILRKFGIKNWVNYQKRFSLIVFHKIFFIGFARIFNKPFKFRIFWSFYFLYNRNIYFKKFNFICCLKIIIKNTSCSLLVNRSSP